MCRFLGPRLRLAYIAPLIDETRNTRVCAARDDSAVFDGATARIMHLLAVAIAVAPPTIVGDVQKNIGAIAGKFGAVIAKLILPTNNGGHFYFWVGGCKNGALFLCAVRACHST